METLFFGGFFLAEMWKQDGIAGLVGAWLLAVVLLAVVLGIVRPWRRKKAGYPWSRYPDRSNVPQRGSQAPLRGSSH